MGRIKSAWEIALEKTKDIELDESRYRTESLEKEGMTLAGSFLNDAEQSVETLSQKYNGYSKEDRKSVREGLIRTIFANLTLPTDTSYRLRFERTQTLCSLADPTGQAASFMNNIGSFFEQFLKAREELASQMEAQIRQAMEQNPSQGTAAQYAKLVEQNVKRMEDQYKGALEQSKENLRMIFEG